MKVLYEDNHLIAINKAPGELSQGDKTGDKSVIDHVKKYLKDTYNKPGNVFCGLIHRLDRPTSGVLLLARTSKALERMNKQFKNKETEKTYWAVVENRPKEPSGELIHFLKKNEKQNKSYAQITEVAGSKKAILNYRLIHSIDRYHLLEIEIETGRHHQIRCQLATIGCIVKGDLKYGAKRSNKDGSIHLHARKLSFMHPVKKENITILAEPPNDKVWELLINRS